jgi:hypothetical protein
MTISPLAKQTIIKEAIETQKEADQKMFEEIAKELEEITPNRSLMAFYVGLEVRVKIT